jgi:hypothetical protein
MAQVVGQEWFFCPHCDRKFTRSGLGKHLSQSKDCSRIENERILEAQHAKLPCTADGLPNPEPAQVASAVQEDLAMESLLTNNHINWQEIPINDPILEAANQPLQPELAQDLGVTESSHIPDSSPTSYPNTSPYPDDLAGYKFERADTVFETWKKKESEGAGSVFDETPTWELAHWLMTSGLSSAARDKFFKLNVSANL